MAPLIHLSSSNVSDTFHKLVQTENGSFSDGSGSAITLFTVTSSHAVSASYAISASHEITYELSSSYADSASYVSGANVDGAVANATTADNAACADRIKTLASENNAEYYIPFVANHNAEVACEPVYTTNNFYINPSKGLLTLLGKFQVKGSDVTIQNGHISASGNLTITGSISGSHTSTGSFAHIITQQNSIEFRQGPTKLAVMRAEQDSVTFGKPGSVNRASIKVRDVSTKGLIDEEVRILDGSITGSGHISMSGTGNNYFDGNILIGEKSHALLKVNGNITASRNISASSRVYGETLYIKDRQTLSYHPSSDSTLLGTTAQQLNVQARSIFYHPISASGDISSSGVITATQFSTAGAGGFGSLQVANVDGTVTIQHGNITASGDISASSTSTITTNEANIKTQLRVGGLVASDNQIAAIDSLRFTDPGDSTGPKIMFRAGGFKLVQNGYNDPIANATDLTLGHVTASGAISASKDITTLGKVSAYAQSLFEQGIQIAGASRLTYTNGTMTMPDTGLSIAGAITASSHISMSSDDVLTTKNIEVPQGGLVRIRSIVTASMGIINYGGGTSGSLGRPGTQNWGIDRLKEQLISLPWNEFISHDNSDTRTPSWLYGRSTGVPFSHTTNPAMNQYACYVIPYGYAVKAVTVYATAGTFNVYHNNVSDVDLVATLLTNGTCDSGGHNGAAEMSASCTNVLYRTPKAGDHLTIQWNPEATSNKLYGGAVLLQTI